MNGWRQLQGRKQWPGLLYQSAIGLPDGYGFPWMVQPVSGYKTKNPGWKQPGFLFY
jgi:hypothetical protein